MIINFIRISGLLEIDFFINKVRNLQEFQLKVREFIALIRNNSKSNILNLFLKKALYIIIKDLRNQVIAFNKDK